MLTREQILTRASTGTRENRSLDFKSEFQIEAAGDWCELIKDIIAFANSGGGAIVVGLHDNGSPSGSDVTSLIEFDGADITNRIHRYTGYQFADFEVVPLVRDGQTVAAIIVAATDVPISFVKPGTYAVDEGRQKTAFSQGTVYFRHGAKSEPGTRDDFLKWRDGEIAARQREWMQGVKRVVDAPKGSTFQVVAANAGAVSTARFGTDPSAPLVRLQNPEEVFPYRQGDVIRLVNEQLPAGMRVSTHDIRCVRVVHSIDPNTQPTLVFKPHSKAGPQYSPDFVQWILQQFQSDNDFFVETRTAFRARPI